MAKRHTPSFVAEISGMERLNNSPSGSPRYRLSLVGGATVDTAPDAQINYGIDNPEYRGVPVRFHTDSRGRVIQAQPEPQPESE